MACATKFVKDMIDSILHVNSKEIKDYLLYQNDHFWVDMPKNYDLLLYKDSTKKFLFDYEEEYYNKNIASNPDHRYFKKQFSYTLDINAFRKYDLKETNKTIYCFGCSNTFGFGLADDETWPYLLSQKFNFEYTPMNYGLIGGSADTIARLVYQTVSIKKPDYVFILFPGMYRKEYITESCRVMNFNVATANGKVHSKENSLYYDKCREEYSSYLRLSNPNESFFNFIKNIKFIELALKDIPFIWGTTCRTLCSNKNVLSRYINISNMIDTDKLNDIPNTHARDGEHYSYNYNECISEKFYELFKKNTI